TPIIWKATDAGKSSLRCQRDCNFRPFLVKLEQAFMLRAIKRQLRHARDFAQYQAGELTGRRGERFEGHYAVWRSRRIATILDEYPARFFEGKTLLELGAGFGAIGAMFGALGAKVTCLEGREQNVRTIRERYGFVTAERQDLNEGLPGNDQYDVIVH